MKTVKIVLLSTFIALFFINASVMAKSYKIATVAWVGWSPSNVADVKGFWEDEGVDVNVYTRANPLDVLDLFKKRLVDIAFDMIGSQVGIYMNGEPLVILAETDWSHGGDKIIVKKDFTPKSIVSKPLGVYFNMPSVTYFLNLYLDSRGLKLSDTRVVEMEPTALANHFIAGRLGAIVCYDPEAIRAVRQGNGRVVATSATYEGCIPEGMMVYKDTLEKIPGEDMVKIMKGWIRAAEWVNDPDNWEEYMKILNNHTFQNDPPYSKDDLKAMFEAVKIHGKSALKERNKKGGGLNAYLKDLKVFLSENERLKKDFSPDALFDNTAITKALQ